MHAFYNKHKSSLIDHEVFWRGISLIFWGAKHSSCFGGRAKWKTPSILYEPYWTQIGTMNWKNSNRASNWDHELKYESQLQTRIKSSNLNYI